MKSLFSFIATLYALVLLYLPSVFSRFLISPALFSALILLLYLLRLGAAQRSTIKQTESDSVELDSTQPLPQQIEELCEESRGQSEPDPKKQDLLQLHLYADSFVEWDVRAPLEVIYEEYEAENDNSESQMNCYASLSLFYPESDSDASSEGDFPGWGSPESACFRWEEEDDREGLIEIEIALDEKKRSCEVEEDNLIEIDLSPER